MAYLADPLFRLILRRMGAGAPPSFLGLAPIVVAVTAVALPLGMFNGAASAIARERDRRALDDLLLSRLGAGQIVLGKAAAVLLPGVLVGSLSCLTWLLVPPFRGGASLLIFRIAQSPREFIGGLWLVLLALSVALTSAGLAVSAWCRSTRWANALAVVLQLVPMLLAAPAISGGMNGWLFAPPPVFVGPWMVAVVWAACALVTLFSYVIAQVRTDPLPTPVGIIPLGVTAVRMSRRAVSLLAVALLAAALMGVGAYGVHHVLVIHRMMAEISGLPAGPAAQIRQHMASARYSEALVLLDEQIKNGPPGILRDWAWSEKATCHRHLHQYREAIAAYDEVRRARSWPNLTIDGWRGMGDCLRAMGHREDAAVAYRNALRAAREVRDLDAPFSDLFRVQAEQQMVWISRSLAQVGNREDAIAVLEEVRRGKDTTAAGAAEKELVFLRERLDAAPRLGAATRAGRRSGPLVLRAPDPNAHRTGLRTNDILRAVQGRPVKDEIALRRILARYKPGDRVSVTVERGGVRRTFRVPLLPP